MTVSGKFEHSLSQFFCECMWDVIEGFQDNDRALDAFRMAAMTLALSRPASTDLLHYVLHHADNEAEEDEDHEESDE